jgi:hypothetical protein
MYMRGFCRKWRETFIDGKRARRTPRISSGPFADLHRLLMSKKSFEVLMERIAKVMRRTACR